MPRDTHLIFDDLGVKLIATTVVETPPNTNTWPSSNGSIRVPEELITELSAQQLGSIIKEAEPTISVLALEERLDNIFSQADSLSLSLQRAPKRYLRETIRMWSELSNTQREHLNDNSIMRLQHIKDNRSTWAHNPEQQGQGDTPKRGFVYIAHADTGHYKIGRSTKPAKRIDHFDTQMPVSVVEVHRFKCDPYRKAESMLHDWASDYCVNGEWFDLDDDQIIALEAIAGYQDGHFRAENGEEVDNEIKSKLR